MRGVHSEHGRSPQWLADHTIAFGAGVSVGYPVPIGRPEYLATKPKIAMLPCALGWDFMILQWRKLKLILLLLCAGALPCQAESAAISLWKQQITTQLQLHPQYPPEACLKGAEAQVAFRIDRAGKLISSDIIKGAGSPAIDKAALQTVKSAEPFTPAPPEVSDDDLKFAVIMVFVKPPSCEPDHREDKLRSAISGVCRGC
jgi:TonB family protein